MNFMDFINLLRCVCVYLFFCFVYYLYRVEDCLPWYGELIHWLGMKNVLL